jgi:hypothetical protein
MKTSKSAGALMRQNALRVKERSIVRGNGGMESNGVRFSVSISMGLESTKFLQPWLFL